MRDYRQKQRCVISSCAWVYFTCGLLRDDDGDIWRQLVLGQLLIERDEMAQDRTISALCAKEAYMMFLFAVTFYAMGSV